jgi:N,N'-diacetyllegionaminate synthase
MSSKIIIIAEAGVNHNGSIDLARKLIDVASEAGVDYVKFQTFKSERLVSMSAQKATYQLKNQIENDVTQYSMLKKLELTEEMHIELIDYCRYKGVRFLSSGFDEGSVDFLVRLGIPIIKIPSGEITNKPYLQHIGRKKMPVIMSTGMADIKEIRQALDLLYKAGLQKEQITVLHCNTEYPTPMNDVNLKAMLTIGKELNVDIGYSDHTLGLEVSIAAVALGAKVIEKHFTIDRNLPGPDHKASLEPDELKALVSAIRNIEKAMNGDGLKKPTPSEMPNIKVARKSIHLAIPIKKGEVITRAHLVMKRPGDGISPMEIDNVVGKKSRVSLDEDIKLAWEWIEE